VDEPRRVTPQEIYPKSNQEKCSWSALMTMTPNSGTFDWKAPSLCLNSSPSFLPCLKTGKSCFIAPDPMKTVRPVRQPG
jgi:hypothetical protein